MPAPCTRSTPGRSRAACLSSTALAMRATATSKRRCSARALQINLQPSRRTAPDDERIAAIARRRARRSSCRRRSNGGCRRSARSRRSSARDFSAGAHRHVSVRGRARSDRRTPSWPSAPSVQHTDDQVATLFGSDRRQSRRSTSITTTSRSAGDFTARGWAVSVTHVVAGHLRGSVDYAVTTAHWRQGGQHRTRPGRALRRASGERAAARPHDVARDRYSRHRDARVRPLSHQQRVRRHDAPRPSPGSPPDSTCRSRRRCRS